MGEVNQCSRRKALSGAPADMADRYDSRPLIEQLLKLLKHLFLIVNDLQKAQSDAIPPHVAVPGDTVAKTLLFSQDDIFLACQLMPIVVFSPSTISSASEFSDCATLSRVASNPSIISS